MTARRLVLLRHAKADTPQSVPDLDRPLSGRGHADAQAAGAWLSSRHMVELVYCSPSKRTRQTWQAVAANLPAPAAPVRYEKALYEGGVDEALALIRGTGDEVGTLLVIGHNPALTQLAFALDPEGELDSDGLRTCGLSVHEVAGSWSGCGPEQVRVAGTHTARSD